MQSYPETERMPWTERPAPPAAVLNAVKVMYAGAAVSVIHAIAYLVTENATKAAISNKYPNWPAGTLNTVTHVGVIIGAIAGLIAAALFIWIARSCRNGKNWARVTGTVFFFIAILGTIYDLVSAEATITAILNFLNLAIGLAAVVLLWLWRSNAFFAYFKRPQF
jgi:DMSO/TMAO reductase YedYZ heme-binding membrane subunit